MKQLVKDQINTLTFVKKDDWSVNSFDIELIKVVGGNVYSFNDLSDKNNLDTCKDYIDLDINLIGSVIGGGEYVLTLSTPASAGRYANILIDRATTAGATIEAVDCLIDAIVNLGEDRSTYIYLCLVKTYETSTGSGIYSNVVTFTDL
jgi:hypothetical protein